MPSYVPITNFRIKDTVAVGSLEKSITGVELYNEYRSISIAINSVAPGRYVPATNFSIKDGLTTGNPLKLVDGDEIDQEFNSIASGITDIGGTYLPVTIFADITPASPIYGALLQDEFDAIKVAIRGVVAGGGGGFGGGASMYDPSGYGFISLKYGDVSGVGSSLQGHYYCSSYGSAPTGSVNYNYTKFPVISLDVMGAGTVSTEESNRYFSLELASETKLNIYDIDWVDLPDLGMSLPPSECCAINVGDNGSSLSPDYKILLAWYVNTSDPITLGRNIRLNIGQGTAPQAFATFTPAVKASGGVITFVAGEIVDTVTGVAPGYHGTIVSNTTGYTVVAIHTTIFPGAVERIFSVDLQRASAHRVLSSHITNVEVAEFGNFNLEQPSFYYFGTVWSSSTISNNSWQWIGDIPAFVSGETYTVRIS